MRFSINRKLLGKILLYTSIVELSILYCNFFIYIKLTRILPNYWHNQLWHTFTTTHSLPAIIFLIELGVGLLILRSKQAKLTHYLFWISIPLLLVGVFFTIHILPALILGFPYIVK